MEYGFDIDDQHGHRDFESLDGEYTVRLILRKVETPKKDCGEAQDTYRTVDVNCRELEFLLASSKDVSGYELIGTELKNKESAINRKHTVDMKLKKEEDDFSRQAMDLIKNLDKKGTRKKSKSK